MSRIGKLSINIPIDVEIKQDNSKLTVKGKFGTLDIELPENLTVLQEEQEIKLNRQNNTKNTRSLHGLYRTLIHNMVIGVSKQFELTLILKGVGFRAAVQGKDIVLNLGYSHPVKIEIPETVSVEVIQNTTINLKSCDKELLGLFAANIRAWRKPEPYKGKGVLYKDERIIRKAGKSAK